MVKNQRGITLMEVLAAIILISIISFLAWNIFFQGKNYTEKSLSKSQMQQEANIILSRLSKIHQSSDTYEVNTQTCSFIIKYTVNGTTKNEPFNNGKLCIKLSNIPNIIDPKTINAIDFNLYIEDINKPDNNILVNSYLYRLKEAP
ncbi:prepilin-type N-terminal cleavage/methylation domain-containing protein [Solibacillus silvestris]